MPSRTGQFIANADAICSRHRPGLAATWRTFLTTGDPSQLIPILQSLESALQGLGPPPGDVPMDTYMDDLMRFIAALKEGDFAGAEIWRQALGNHGGEVGLQTCPPN